MIQDNTVFYGDIGDPDPETDAVRDPNGRFVAGHTQGRPKGAISKSTELRNRLIETIKMLDEDPKCNGDFLLWFGREYPEKFLSLVASLLPRQLKIESVNLHSHIPIMDLSEVARAKVFEECRRRIVEVRGVEVVERKDVKVLNEGKP